VHLRTPEAMLSLCGIAIVCAMSWTYINAPQDTGTLVGGEVSYCGISNYYVDNHWCVVWIDNPHKWVRVYMPPQMPGKRLTLIETRTRLTGRVNYIVRYSPKI